MRVSINSVMLMYLCLLLVFGYHSACSQIYNYSVNKRLATAYDEKRRKQFMIVIGVLTLIALVVTIVIIILRPPRNE